MVKLFLQFLHSMKYKSVFNGCMGLLLSILCAACSSATDTLVILHTNDTHSQIEPIAAGKRDGDHAGYARRMGLIQQEREANPNLILVDAGDFCQGTPYFNFYRGRMEVEAFNRMGYDAVTFGNHEFDNGIEDIAKHNSKCKSDKGNRFQKG